MSALRVVVVGAGKMGAHHARVFAVTPGAKLEAVCDVDASRAARVAAAHGAGMARTIDEAIERADLVVIATPTTMHFAHACAALVKGRYVLVEKPLCTDAAEARTLGAIARANGTEIFIGHSERFNPVVRAIARDIAGDAVLRFATRRTSDAARGEDLCLNLAVHDIDLAALFCGPRVDLRSASGDGEGAEILLDANGALARLSVARSSRRVRTIDVQTARFSYAGNLDTHQAWRDVTNLSVDRAEPLALQALATVKAISRSDPNGSPVARVADGERAVSMARKAMSLLLNNASPCQV